jgi:Uma2 family endonuclease
LAILPGPAALYRGSHPASAELVVEVAVSSREIDRIKAAIYAEAGVKEYWIVCPEEREIEVCRTPSAAGFRDREVIRSPFVVKSTALGNEIDLAGLFN